MKTMHASHVESQFFISSRLHPTPALNTLAFAVRVAGALDTDRLSAALETAVCRHLTLRTRYVLEQGEISRTLNRDCYSPVLTRVESPGTAEAVADAMEDLRRSLSPEERPWATALLRHGADEHTLLFAFHRLVWDETSTGIFAGELSRIYASGDNGEEALPSVDTEASVESVGDPGPFARSLDGVPRLHGFPTKAARPRQIAVQTDEAAYALPDALAGLLRDRSRDWGIPDFQIQCAAAAYVLAAHAGQTSLAIGLPFDLRKPDATSTLGSLTAILPVGVDTAVQGGFEAFARSFAERYASLRQHAGVPFDEIVAACKASSDPGANSVF